MSDHFDQLHQKSSDSQFVLKRIYQTVKGLLIRTTVSIQQDWFTSIGGTDGRTDRQQWYMSNALCMHYIAIQRTDNVMGARAA